MLSSSASRPRPPARGPAPESAALRRDCDRGAVLELRKGVAAAPAQGTARAGTPSGSPLRLSPRRSDPLAPAAPLPAAAPGRTDQPSGRIVREEALDFCV